MKNKFVFVIGITQGGGAEKRAIFIAKLLKDKFDTKVFAFSGKQIDGVDYVLKPTYEEYKKLSIIKRTKLLREYLINEQPDYVFSFVPHINLFVTLALRHKPLKNVKHIVSIVFHGFTGKNKLFLKYSIRKADAVYYQTSDQKILLPCKCDSFVLPNPISIPPIEKHDGHLKFISVGRLEYQKDYQLQINVFKKIVDCHKDATLDIFGSGSLKAELNSLINELDLINNVFIHDYTENINKEYKKHDIFLFTTRYEGFPNALAEAMSHNLICFSTTFQTGCNDLLINGSTGFVCDSRNPDDYATMVNNALKDYDRCKQIALKGKHHVKDLCDIEVFKDNLIKELEAL